MDIKIIASALTRQALKPRCGPPRVSWLGEQDSGLGAKVQPPTSPAWRPKDSTVDRAGSSELAPSPVPHWPRELLACLAGATTVEGRQ